MCEPVDILLIEDNDSEAELALLALKKSGNQSCVRVIYDGAEALEFLFCEGQYANRKPENNPRIIFLDINIPKINGLEVLERLRCDTRTEHIPVIMLTNSLQQRDVNLALQWRADRYVQKPVDFMEFLEAMKEILSQWL